MKEKAVIIDVYSHGSYHEVINQAYLMMISNLYKKVTYIADKSACDNLKLLLTKCHFDYSNVHFEEKYIKCHKFRRPGLTYLARLLKVSVMNFVYYNRCEKDEDVFFNNNLFFAIILISIFSKKKNNIYDLCHNEMEFIDKQTSHSLTTDILSLYFRLVFCWMRLSEKFHFILLSPKMVEYFNSFISPKNQKRMFWIDHSYIRPEIKIETDYKISNECIKIGIPGAITPLRGLDTLKQILSHITNDNICIYALSTCSEEINDKHFIMLNSSNKLLPFEKYNAYVQSMDAMLLLYDTNSYKLTASGAILESIWNEKPIIALTNAYFEYLFDKFGTLGVLCNDVKTLIEEIDKFRANSLYRENISSAKNSLYPESVQTQLFKIVKGGA